MNLFGNLKKLISDEKGISKSGRKSDDNDEISQEEINLAQKLDEIEIFTVDRIEDNVVVLEDRTTEEIINVSVNELPNDINTGDIIKKINGKYFIDREETKSVEKRIEDKMNNLWN